MSAVEIEKVRCRQCRRFFDQADEDGWVLDTTASRLEGDNDPDFLCSARCLVLYATEEWTGDIERAIRRFDAATKAEQSDEGSGR